MNRPFEPTTPAAPTLEALAAALAEKERALVAANARQEATADILRIISRSTDDAQPVFEAIVLAGVRLLHCDVAGLFECDGAVYSPVAGADPTGLITLYGPSKVPIDPAATFPSRAIVSRHFLEIPDWSKIELPPVERQVREASGLNSTIYLPLLREGACVALLVFGSNRPNNFGPDEIAIAESFRDHALIAIDNARLFNEATARTRDLEESLQQQTATADVLKVISRSVFDLQAVLDTLVASAYKLCGARMGLLYLAGEDAFECRAIAGTGVPDAEAMFKNRPIRAGRGTAAERVILTGDVESIEDFYADPDFDPKIKAAIEAAGARGSGIGDFRSTLAVPMKRDDKVVGVIAIARAETGPFPQRQIELLQTFADQAVIAIENARLFGEVQAKTRDLSEALVYQTGSANILKAIAASPTDVAPVLEAIVESACEVCNAYDAVVLLRDGGDLRASAHRGPIPPSFDRIAISRTRVVGRAFLDQKPVHVPDITLAGEDFPDGRELARRSGFRAILAVPLIRDNESIGAIVVRRSEPYSFSEKQIALLQTFADQAMIAIGNVRLFDEVQARTHDLAEALQQQTATSDVLKVISRSAFDLQAVLDTLVESAVSLIDASSGVIWLRDGDVFTVKAASSDEEQQTFFAQLRARPQRPGRSSIGGRVLLTGEVQVISDIKADPEYDPFIKAATNARTLLGVPLLRDGVIIGAFVLALHKLGTFTPRQIDLVKTFADQAVIAIENARLFDEVQARTRDLSESLEQQTATADVLKVISRSVFDLETVLQTLIDTAVRLGRGSRGTIFIRKGDVLVASAFHRNVPKELRDYLATTPWRTDGDSDMARAVRERKVVHIPDLSKSQDAATSEVRKRAAFGAALWVPLMRDGEAIGLFGVPRDEAIAFTDREIEIVKTFSDQAVIAIENARLFDEVQARTRDLTEALQQQTATADVLKVISRSAFDLQTVFDTLLSSAVALSGAGSGVLAVREGDVFRAKSFVNKSPDLVRFLSENPITPNPGTVMGRVALSGRIDWIEDTLADSALSMQKVIQRTNDDRALVGVPLLRDGRVEGAIVLGRSEPGRFGARSIELAQTFADQAVIAIENARLFEEVQAKTRDLEESLQQQTATADVLKVISRSAFDLDTVLKTLAQSAQRLCDAEGSMIFVRDGDVYPLAACVGMPDAFIEFRRANPLRADRLSAVGRVALTGETAHLPDVTADPDIQQMGPQLGGFRAVLSVPLVRESEVVGIFALSRATPGPFAPGQVKLVQTFADQAAIAIANVRLFNEVKRKTEDLSEALQQQTATADVLKVISRSAFGLQTVLQTLVDTAVRFCASDGVIYLRHGDIFVAEASFDSDASGLARKRMPRRPGRESVTGRVALSGQVEQIPDNLADPEFTVPTDQRMKMRSLIGVPLLRDGAVEGVFVLGRPEPGPFSERAVELVKSFADQAVIAIQNVRLFEALQAKTHDLEETLDGLRKAQDRLIQSEKLASLGQLTAGIAHEIKNPLNFVNNFSGLSRELIDELREVLAKAPLEAHQRAEADDLIGMLSGNLEKVLSHGKRADSIVKNMLLHSREGSGERASVNVNAMVEEALNLAYHGARAERPGFNVTIEKSLDPAAGAADLYAQEMTRVILNLISNAFYATTKRKQAEADDPYEPTVQASTRDLGAEVEIVIRDNGTGIPPDVQAKMFNPFFTTKPAGEGTGLGLSLSHDIVVKQHGGTLDVASEPGAFTEFTIVVPRALVKTGAAS